MEKVFSANHGARCGKTDGIQKTVDIQLKIVLQKGFLIILKRLTIVVGGRVITGHIPSLQ